MSGAWSWKPTTRVRSQAKAMATMSIIAVVSAGAVEKSLGVRPPCTVGTAQESPPPVSLSRPQEIVHLAEVRVEPLPIAAAELAAERLVVSLERGEDELALCLPILQLLELGGIEIAEHGLEDLVGIALGRDGRLPLGVVDTPSERVVRGVNADAERRKPRRIADLPRDRLIDRLELGEPRGLAVAAAVLTARAGPGPREERAGTARVPLRRIAAVERRAHRDALDDEAILGDGLELFHRAREREARVEQRGLAPLNRALPPIHHEAVGRGQKDDAPRGLRRLGRGRADAADRQHRVEEGKAEGEPCGAAEEVTAAERVAVIRSASQERRARLRRKIRRGGSGEIDAATRSTIGAGHDAGAGAASTSAAKKATAGAGAGDACCLSGPRDVALAIATTASR